jgi:tRNA threonylcarbamoyladenosine biosynthesis protein TsaB
MLILALDTATVMGSLVLGTPAALVHQVEFEGRSRHSQTLFPALAQFGLPRLALTRVVVGLGPGSFSGIRVGLAAAYAIAQVQGCPVIGVSSTVSVARQFPDVTRLGIFADARRGQVYVTVYAMGQLERDTYLIERDQLEDEMSKMTLAVSGDPSLPGPQLARPHARDYLDLPEDFEQFRHGPDLEPVYLRDAVAAGPLAQV